MPSNLFRFKDPATGKTFNFTFNPPKPAPPIPLRGYNQPHLAKRAIRKKKK